METLTYMKITLDENQDLENTGYGIPIVLKEMHDIVTDPLYIKIGKRCLEFMVIEKYINILNNIENYIKQKDNIKMKITKKVYVQR